MFWEKGTGFYHYTETVTELPMKSHSIALQTVGQSYWTHRRLRLTDKEDPGLLPPRLVTYDNILTRGSSPRKGKAASDGSVHLRGQVAAAACVIATGTEHYRPELEGIFRALNHIEFLNWAPTELDQWCDNK